MTIRQRRFKLGRDLCAYCGVNVATQREDPIPRNLYPEELRAQLQFLKVPACSDCNNTKSRVDNALRDFLVIDLDSSVHVVAQKIFEQKMETAVNENHVRLLDDFYSGSDVPVFNREGQFDGLAYAVPADLLPVYEAVKWLTRGLYWAALGKAIDANSTEVKLVDRYRRLDSVMKLSELGFTGVFVQGPPFRTGWLASATGSAFWAHVFFDSVLFLARTTPPESGIRASQSA